MNVRVAVLLPRVIAPVYGASVAFNEWIHGILSHTTFDGCHIFCHGCNVQFVRRLYSRYPSAEVFSIEELPQKLRLFQYAVLVCRGVSKMASLCAVRDACSQQRVPVCSITTTLSYYSVYLDVFHSMLVCNPATDLFFCGTPTAARVVTSFIEHLKGAPGASSTSLSEKNIVVLPHGVDLKTFSNLPDKATCCRWLNIPADSPIILSVGRLSFFDKVDYETLLSAFEILRRTAGRRLRLIIAGDNADRGASRISAQAKKMGIAADVTVLTSFLEEQKPLLYGAADVFVSLANSVQESFGLTILEAMASGLPIVATDWDGYRDLIVDGVHGLLVRTSWQGDFDSFRLVSPLHSAQEMHALLAQAVKIDATEVAEKIRLVLEEPGKALELASAARKRAAEFAWPLVMRRAEAMWRAASTNGRESLATAPSSEWLLLDYGHAFAHYSSAFIRS